MIDTIKQEERRIKQEDLLNNMKMIRHNAADILNSKFLKGLVPEPHNGMITVHDEQFPIYISSNIISAKEQECLPNISSDIFDKSNYLSLLTNDDLMWYALAEYLAHQADLLQEDNIKYEDELIDANFRIDKLECEVAKEIETRQKHEEENKSLKEENRILRGKYDNLRSAFNSTYGMSIANDKDMRQTVTNEAMGELVTRINELEKENESLKDENNKYKEALADVDDALSEANTLLERMILDGRKETKNR